MLLEENKVLKNEIDELKAKLNKDSSNSNMPPPKEPNKQTIEQFQVQKACFVIGTNILNAGYSDKDIFFAFRGQSSFERGFRFLKDKTFFVSSLFLENPPE